MTATETPAQPGLFHFDIGDRTAGSFKLEDFPTLGHLPDEMTLGEVRQMLAEKFPPTMPRSVADGLKYLTNRISGMPKATVLGRRQAPLDYGLAVRPMAILAMFDLLTGVLGDGSDAPKDIDSIAGGQDRLEQIRAVQERRDIEAGRERFHKLGYIIPANVDPRGICGDPLDVPGVKRVPVDALISDEQLVAVADTIGLDRIRASVPPAGSALHDGPPAAPAAAKGGK